MKNFMTWDEHLDMVKQIEEGCDGRCALGECVCPEGGWEVAYDRASEELKAVAAQRDQYVKAMQYWARDAQDQKFLKDEMQDKLKRVEMERDQHLKAVQFWAKDAQEQKDLKDQMQEKLKQAEKERDHWKANHEDMKNRNAVLMQRPDLDITRIPVYLELERKLRLILEENDFLWAVLNGIGIGMYSESDARAQVSRYQECAGGR